jgi:Domain of unknown function (DUF4440)
MALLGALEHAAEARDADRFAALLSDSFVGQDGLSRRDAITMLRRYLAAYETVAIDLYDVKVERSGGTASVTLRADFAGETRKLGPLAGLLPASAFYEFELQVGDEGGAWKVARASWKAVAPPTGDADGR